MAAEKIIASYSSWIPGYNIVDVTECGSEISEDDELAEVPDPDRLGYRRLSTESTCYATNFASWRDFWSDIHWNKIIVLGQFCEGADNLQLDYEFEQPDQLAPQAPGEEFEFEAPSYALCGVVVPLEDVTITFVDTSPGLSAEPVDWVTLDRSTGMVKVTATAEAFATYML